MHITNTETFMAQRVTVETSPHSTETWLRIGTGDWVFDSAKGHMTGMLLPTQLEQIYRDYLA